MNLYSPTLTPNFDLPWPLRPLFDLLDNFFQLQNMQLNRFINGTPWYMAKTCATGFQNLGCYAAKTAFYFIEEPIVQVLFVTAGYQATFQAAMGDVRAQEYGLQLYKDNKDKYEINAKDDW